MVDENPLPKSADAVVIGGGIVGCSTALYLAQQGLNVTLCEKGHIAGEQSSRNWGFIRIQGRNPAEIPLMALSHREWQLLAKQSDQDFGYHVGGTLYLSENRQRYQANLDWLERVREFELDSRFLSLKELKTLVPGIAQQERGALYTPSDARAEPEKATRAIARLAQQHGAGIYEGCAVRGVELSAGRVCGVVTELGAIKTDTVICAGGAWSGYFCRHLDLVFPHLKVISSVMATQATSFSIAPSIWSSGLGLRKRDDGGFNVAYGGSSSCELTPDFFRFLHHYIPAYRHSKEQVKLKLGRRFVKELRWPKKWAFDQQTPFERERVLNPPPDLKLLQKAYHTLGQIFPELQNIDIQQRWAGMIDVTPDELPIVSTVAQIPGLVLSTGYSGHGFGIGPGAGKITAQIATGVGPEVDIAPLSLTRFIG